jgi:hypothetical protein
MTEEYTKSQLTLQEELTRLIQELRIPVMRSTLPVMWSSIPASGPPFRYTFKNRTNSHRNPGPDPAGILDQIPPESWTRSRRNRGPLHTGITGPIAPESAQDRSASVGERQPTVIQ